MKRLILTAAVIISISLNFKAQTFDEIPIYPAVPFLTITPDARGGSLSETGAATTPDVASIYHNPSKYSFIDSKAGIIISYSPWLRSIANDMMINYLGGFYKFNDRQAFAASIKYFSVGEIDFTNNFGDKITVFKPNEFAIDGAYSLKLAENFGGAISLRIIYSNLTGGSSNVTGSHAGFAVASDLSFFYSKNFEISENKANFSWGLNLSNMGSKITYGTNATGFIPSNFKTGAAFTYSFDDFNKIMLALDVNKLLVPSSPIYEPNTTNVIAGTDLNNTSVVEGIFRSFYDAPNGFKEELHELYYSTGAEYAYNNRFFIRGGYYYEHPKKGDRQYVNIGLGFKYSIFNIDFSYLIPVVSKSALEGTMRFTLNFYFNKKQ